MAACTCRSLDGNIFTKKFRRVLKSFPEKWSLSQQDAHIYIYLQLYISYIYRSTSAVAHGWTLGTCNVCEQPSSELKGQGIQPFSWSLAPLDRAGGNTCQHQPTDLDLFWSETKVLSSIEMGKLLPDQISVLSASWVLAVEEAQA